MTIHYTASMIENLAKDLVQYFPAHGHGGTLVGIPRGGIPVAHAIAHMAEYHHKGHWHVRGPDDPYTSDLPRYLVDDVFVTGKTVHRVMRESGPFGMVLVLVHKQWDGPSVWDNEGDLTAFYAGEHRSVDDWLMFPWEQADESAGPEDAVRRLIEYIGDDPKRPGLVETPRRVLAMYDELRTLRETEIKLTTFEDDHDDLMIVKDIPLYSLCEHHMSVYQGTAHVGFIPAGKVLGLSKVARIVAQAQSGLTMQETLTRAIGERVSDALGSPHVGVVTTASHSCMNSRGVRAHGSETTVSAMQGAFKQDVALRQEFVSLMGV